nr:unnamed protein product [Callosobruchus analis]
MGDARSEQPERTHCGETSMATFTGTPEYLSS